MKRLILLLTVWSVAPPGESDPSPPTAADRVTIQRDEWGVPHIFGPTDASVVFGAAYAQAEDNWWQVEDNLVRAIGRGAELYGEDALLDDYLARGLEISRRSIEEYERAPERMRRLYDAYAAGFNHFLETHPDAERRVLGQVQPWHTLALIRFKYHHNEYLGYAGLRRHHSQRVLERARVGKTTGTHGGGRGSERALASLAWPPETRSPNGERALGSNEWAVAGSRTASGYPMLLINPHVSFFGLSTYTCRATRGSSSRASPGSGSCSRIWGTTHATGGRTPTTTAITEISTLRSWTRTGSPTDTATVGAS
jgi:penicillin amidase